MSQPPHNTPSATVENYLKVLYRLTQQMEDPSDKIRTKAIAKELDVSLPSVTTMMKSFHTQGFVEWTAYHGASLTPKGAQEALKVIRKHRLVEVFLVETLHYTWDEVHEEAEQLEHAMSDRLTNRMDAFLGRPRFDPHGDPIPNAEGVIETRNTRSLLNVAPNQPVTVCRVLEQSKEALRYLAERDIQPGTVLTIETIEPFDGPVWLVVNNGRVALSRTLAQCVEVEE